MSQKELLYEKAKGKCAICNQKILTIEDAEADHIIPFSKGGKTEMDNGQIAHRFCNRQKSNKENIVKAITMQETLIDVFAIYKGRRVRGKFDISTFTLVYKRVSYESPSSAAVRAKADLGAVGKISANGWQFWKYKNDKEQINSIDKLRS